MPFSLLITVLLPVRSLPGSDDLPQLGWRHELPSLPLIFSKHCYIPNVTPRGLPANWMCKLKSFKSLQGVTQIFIPANREEIHQIHPGATFPSLPCWHACKVLDKGTANPTLESFRTNSLVLPPILKNHVSHLWIKKKIHKGSKVVFIIRLFFLSHPLFFLFIQMWNQ